MTEVSMTDILFFTGLVAGIILMLAVFVFFLLWHFTNKDGFGSATTFCLVLAAVCFTAVGFLGVIKSSETSQTEITIGSSENSVVEIEGTNYIIVDDKAYEIVQEGEKS